MAKKSFKKGVKNVINSIETGNEPAPEAKKKPAAKTQKKAATQKTNPAKIKLGPAYTVQNSNELKSTLETALKSKEKIEISSVEITEIDIAFIQLLIAFDEAAKMQKRDIEYDIRFSSDVNHMLTTIGMKDALSAFTKK